MTEQTWQLELPVQDGNDSDGVVHTVIPPSGADQDRQGDTPIEHTPQVPSDLGVEASP